MKAKDITGNVDPHVHPARSEKIVGVPPKLPALPKSGEQGHMDPHEEQIFERIVGGQIPAKRIV